MFCLGHPCTAHRICQWGLIPLRECAVWKANNVQMWGWEHPPPLSETEEPDSGPVGIRCRKIQKRLFIKNRQHKLHSSHRNKSASIMKKDNSDKCITFSHIVQMKDEKVSQTVWKSTSYPFGVSHPITGFTVLESFINSCIKNLFWMIRHQQK